MFFNYRAGACVDDQESRAIHRRGCPVAERPPHGGAARDGKNAHGQGHGVGSGCPGG